MKIKSERLFLAIFILIVACFILLFLPIYFTSLFTAESADYSVSSSSAGLASSAAESLSYSAVSNSGYQQPSANATSASYSASAGSLPPSSSSTTTTPSAETPSSGSTTSGGGGGGSRACTYNWICTEWYPSPCPENEIQNRLCINKGTCTGNVGIPAQDTSCIFEGFSGPLFDIFVDIPVTNKIFPLTKNFKGSALDFDVELSNKGKIEQLDVFFRYTITSENNKFIAEVRETRAIKEDGKFKASMDLPRDILPGLYKLYVEITYDDGKIAVAEDTFRVLELSPGIASYYTIIVIVIVLIMIITILIRRNSKRR